MNLFQSRKSDSRKRNMYAASRHSNRSAERRAVALADNRGRMMGRNEHLSHLTQDNFRDYVLAQTQTKFKAERHGQLALF